MISVVHITEVCMHTGRHEYLIYKNYIIRQGLGQLCGKVHQKSQISHRQMLISEVVLGMQLTTVAMVTHLANEGNPFVARDVACKFHWWSDGSTTCCILRVDLLLQLGKVSPTTWSLSTIFSPFKPLIHSYSLTH